MMAGILLAALHPITFIVVQDVSQLVPIYILAGLYWVFISSSLFIWQMNLIPEERGVYTGFLNFINGLSWAVGPLLGGFLSEAFGLQVSAFISSGIVLASFSTLFKVPDSLDEQNILMLSQPIRPREIIMSVDKAK
jgi:MFS family permease